MIVTAKQKRAEALGNKAKERSYHPYSKEEARALLPKVGIRVIRTPTELLDDRRRRGTRLKGTVVEVNPFALWYRVRFDCGYCQCYKVPEV